MVLSSVSAWKDFVLFGLILSEPQDAACSRKLIMGFGALELFFLDMSTFSLCSGEVAAHS